MIWGYDQLTLKATDSVGSPMFSCNKPAQYLA